MHRLGQWLGEGHAGLRRYLRSLGKRAGLKLGVMVACLLIALGTVISGFYIVVVIRDLPALSLPLGSPAGVKVYDRHGTLLGVIGRQAVSRYEDLPVLFIHALLATEDRHFFEHAGVSLRGLLRAMLTDLVTAGFSQGGSTISMQTVRLLTGDRSSSLRRKIRELVLACRLDQRLSKEEILALYTNLCYFGEGQYGLEAASQYYFGIPARELAATQAATLVAMLKAPNIYSRRDPDRLKARRNLVLKLMAEQGYLDDRLYQQATAGDLHWGPAREQRQNLFFLDFIATKLSEHFGTHFLSICAEVHTTLDGEAQRAALEAIGEFLADVDARLGLPRYGEAPFAERQRYPQIAFVALDVADNRVLAWVGGRDYSAAPFNAIGGRVLAHRQPGSAFKTFSYALAMASGISPELVLVDGPITLTDRLGRAWSPQNYESAYYGPTILKLMLVKSLNSMAVRLSNEYLSPERLSAFARDCGIRTYLPPHPSLALGTVEVTPLEMASAYAVFARQGMSAGQPYAIRKVIGRDGTVLFRAGQREPSQPVLDRVGCFYTIDAMKDVINQGTARRIRSLISFSEVAGKTGTSTGYRDAWFLGLTPRVACAAWIGFDDNRSMVNPETNQVIVGGNSAALIVGRFWQEYRSALQGHFWQPPPEALLWFRINPHTGEPDGLNPEAVGVPYVLRSYLGSAVSPRSLN